MILMESKLMKFVEKQQKLTDAQLKVLADIGIATGQLSAASMVLPFLVSGLSYLDLTEQNYWW
ncbi:hypothetical protein KKB40_03735 [Patescibacteria group bacterium]|nr:hypothetical protein [Patescibacteria group bacterium]